MSLGSCQPGETTETLPQAASDDFVELFTSQYSRLVGVLRISGAGGAAEDMAQEAFARTLGHWRRVREGTNPAGYLYRVAFNLLKRRVGLAEDPLGDIDAPSAAPGPEDTAIDSIGATAALDAMPPRRRACAALVCYLGFTSDEAGAILGIDGATVRTQLERARRAAAPLITSG